jgi:ribosomal protein S17
VDTGKEKIWAAAPQFAVKVGDQVSFSKTMPMKDFQSKTLNRTFELVYFNATIDTAGTGRPAGTTGQTSQAVPKDEVHAGLHKPGAAKAPPAVVDFSGIEKAAGGLTVGEVYQQKSKLEKKPVTFRGKVVKYNSQVMNKNWVHVRDGTGTPGANDVTVTTHDTTQVGDTVLVKGTVALNKDYGHGYKYDLVVEDAKVAVEKAK